MRSMVTILVRADDSYNISRLLGEAGPKLALVRITSNNVLLNTLYLHVSVGAVTSSSH